jgi:hypothetical protein
MKDKSKEVGFEYFYENTPGRRKRPDVYNRRFPRPNLIVRGGISTSNYLLRKIRQLAGRK